VYKGEAPEGTPPPASAVLDREDDGGGLEGDDQDSATSQRLRRSGEDGDELLSSVRRDPSWVCRDGAAARDQLVAANPRVVVSTAKRYTSSGIAVLDLIQQGTWACRVEDHDQAAAPGRVTGPARVSRLSVAAASRAEGSGSERERIVR
jgi:hypothetical protein